MSYKTIISKVLVGLILIICFAFMSRQNQELSNQINILTDNIEQINTQNSTLTFKSKQLKEYIKNKDTSHKHEIDSILSAHKVKVSNLINYQKISISSIETDVRPTVIVSKDSTFKNDSIYHLKFYHRSKCNYLEGSIKSLDPKSQIIIDSLASKNTIYITKSYKKTFWDWLFFRDGTEITKTTSDCGNVNTQNLEIIK
jgi:hypothetical protein